MGRLRTAQRTETVNNKSSGGRQGGHPQGSRARALEAKIFNALILHVAACCATGERIHTGEHWRPPPEMPALLYVSARNAPAAPAPHGHISNRLPPSCSPRNMHSNTNKRKMKTVCYKQLQQAANFQRTTIWRRITNRRPPQPSMSKRKTGRRNLEDSENCLPANLCNPRVQLINDLSSATKQVNHGKAGSCLFAFRLSRG